MDGSANSRWRLRVGQDAIDGFGRKPTKLVSVPRTRPGGRTMETEGFRLVIQRRIASRD